MQILLNGRSFPFTPLDSQEQVRRTQAGHFPVSFPTFLPRIQQGSPSLRHSVHSSSCEARFSISGSQRGSREITLASMVPSLLNLIAYRGELRRELSLRLQCSMMYRG
jgi:hypothetical protein